jgi:hypothetical protein
MAMTDRDILRGLAAEVAELAQDPIQIERLEGWKALNSLKPHRPMLWITEIPWREFEDDVAELRPLCEDARARRAERGLRRKIFTARELGVDEVLTGDFHVNRVMEGRGYGVEFREERIEQGAAYIQSHHYLPVIKELEDVEKIRTPEISCNAERTAERVDYFETLFGDILSVKEAGVRQQSFTDWDLIVMWTGVTEALMDLVLRPDYIHAIMRRLTDAFLASMTQLEEQNLLDYPHPLDRVHSGAAGYTDELPQPDADLNHIRLIDQWGGVSPQIFSDVSPEMHQEFALQYEIEVLSRCGLNYYGCCEPLHNKMHLMAKIPRLRKISVSAWGDVAKAVSSAQDTYVFSHKPSPASLAEDVFNEERAEQDLRDRLARSGDMPCEIIMKDISTVRGDIRRIIDWCAMANRVIRDPMGTMSVSA